MNRLSHEFLVLRLDPAEVGVVDVVPVRVRVVGVAPDVFKELLKCLDQVTTVLLPGEELE